MSTKTVYIAEVEEFHLLIDEDDELCSTPVELPVDLLERYRAAHAQYLAVEAEVAALYGEAVKAERAKARESEPKWASELSRKTDTPAPTDLNVTAKDRERVAAACRQFNATHFP